MDLIANDLSIHEQFQNISSFRAALKRLMAMRDVAKRFNRDLQCHRGFVNVEPVTGVAMQQAIQQLTADERRATMNWFTKHGPFWDDLRKHDPDDWLECRSEVVTDSAIGEAAFRKLNEVECGLVSATPSNWDFSPVEVTWRREANGLADLHTELDNWREIAELERMLRDVAPPIMSWIVLQQTSISRFKNLTFTEDCFDPLNGYPYAKSAVEQFTKQLSILDRLTRTFNASGGRTPEGHRIYHDFFTGDRAQFSDSSETEKRDFRNELTFAHPDLPGEQLFCSWHGKVSHGMYRLHFSWPIRADEPVYIVYAGPKITRR